MKWNRLYIIKLSPDNLVHGSAKLYRLYHKLPPEQCWFDTDPFEDLEHPDKDKNWSKLSDGCFKNTGVPAPDAGSKIMIIAHGNDRIVGSGGVTYRPARLAASFAKWGITEVGLITFKCCDVGNGLFLKEFYNQLPQKNIRVGWLKAYKGGTQTVKRMKHEPTKAQIKKLNEEYGGAVRHLAMDENIAGKAKQPYELVTTIGQRGALSGDDRFVVVPGNAPHDVPNSSRYMINNFIDEDDE